MLKKTIILASMLTALGTATSMAHTGFYKSGFLAGAHVGYSFGWGTFNGIHNINVAGIPLSNVSGRAKKSGPLFGFVGGYRHLLNQGYTFGADIGVSFYGGNELKKQLNNAIVTPINTVVTPFVNRIKRNYTIVPSLNFGRVFCGRYHVAVGLGLGIARFRQQVDNINAMLSAKASQTKFGFVPSVKGEYALSPPPSLTGDISYEIYQKVKKQFGSTATAFPGGSYTSSITPKYLTLKIGAIYRF